MIGIVFGILSPFALVFLIYTGVSYITGTDAFWYMREPVWLQDHRGEWTKSRIHRDKNGIEWAPVYASTLTGHVVLNPDGEAKGESSWIVAWSREKPKRNDGKIEVLNKKYVKKF